MTTAPQGQQLAFIGLGFMGGPRASHLVTSGFTVTGYDINPAAMERLCQAGGQSAYHNYPAGANMNRADENIPTDRVRGIAERSHNPRRAGLS
jgi:UDP-N-acetyl-D-mannosaminuronate dehydrogenase